jgi:tol-pal system protein YbgF
VALTMRAALFALALAALPGCFWATTKDEGAAMRRDIDELKATQAKQGETLSASTKTLDEALEKATRFLATTNADLGSEVDKLSADQAQQAGQIENLSREVIRLRAEVDTLKAENAELRAKAAQPTAPPVDKDGLYARAQASFKGGQAEAARRDFREFLRLYSADQRADDAQYALGELLFREKQFDKAIGEFQRVIDAWPQGDMAPYAFYRAGEAALEMKWCVDARAYFGELVRRFPKAPQVKDAKAKLDYVKKNAGKKDVCAN